MRRAVVFAEGVGAGAGLVLVLGALLLLTRTRLIATAARRIEEGSRYGRSPLEYLDVCRAAGL